MELLLEKADADAPSLVVLQDADGNCPLHLGALASPMASYLLAALAPQACLLPNSDGVTPIDMAMRHGGEAVNALLLACSASASPQALDAIRALIAQGAVADTWAPNGQSSLMLAAAADSVEGVTLLLDTGASLELQDALGRTALMWAAGCNATKAMTALLDAGASVAQRDRRGRTAVDYTAEFPEARAVLDGRVKEMESKAAAAQEALLAELNAEEERKAASKANKKAKKKEKKVKKKGAGGGRAAGAEEEDAGPAAAAAAEAADANIPSRPSPPAVPAAEPSSGQAAPPTAATAEEPAPSQPSQAEARTPTDVPSAAELAPPRPRSPEWCTVHKHGKHAAPATAPSKPLAPSVAGSAAGSAHRRSPSVTSVTSTCSVASHDTESSRQSGSERSVLRRTAAATGTGSQPAMPPAQPAPTRKPSSLSRVHSATDEAAAATGAAFGGGGDPAQQHKALQLTGFTSWASVATGQRGPGSVPSSQGLGGFGGDRDRPSGAGSSVRSAGTSSDEELLRVPTPPSGFIDPGTATPQPGAGFNPAAAAAQHSMAEEISALRGEIKRLHLRAAAAELSHQQELAAVLQDAAHHERSTVAQAVLDERMACVVRFAGFLQSNNGAMATAMPNLLGGAGLAATGAVDGADISSVLSSFSPQSGGQERDIGPAEDAQEAVLSSLGFPPSERSGRAAATPPVPLPKQAPSLFGGKPTNQNTCCSSQFLL